MHIIQAVRTMNTESTVTFMAGQKPPPQQQQVLLPLAPPALNPRQAFLHLHSVKITLCLLFPLRRGRGMEGDTSKKPPLLTSPRSHYVELWGPSAERHRPPGDHAEEKRADVSQNTSKGK